MSGPGSIHHQSQTPAPVLGLVSQDLALDLQVLLSLQQMREQRPQDHGLHQASQGAAAQTTEGEVGCAFHIVTEVFLGSVPQECDSPSWSSETNLK